MDGLQAMIGAEIKWLIDLSVLNDALSNTEIGQYLNWLAASWKTGIRFPMGARPDRLCPYVLKT